MYPQLFSIKSFKFPPLLAGRHYLRKAEVQSREKYKTSSEFPRKIRFETLDSYNELFNYCMSIELQTVDSSEMCQTSWRSYVTKLGLTSFTILSSNDSGSNIGWFSHLRNNKIKLS